MPQFDILTLSSQIFSLLISLSFCYIINIKNSLSYYTSIKKYRNKKIILNNSTIEKNKTSLENNLWLLNNSYEDFLK